jgi:hypothetical protein
MWEACGWFLERVCYRECTLPNCATDCPRKIYGSLPSTTQWTVAFLQSAHCWEVNPTDLSGNVSSSSMCKAPASAGSMESLLPDRIPPTLISLGIWEQTLQLGSGVCMKGILGAPLPLVGGV